MPFLLSSTRPGGVAESGSLFEVKGRLNAGATAAALAGRAGVLRYNFPADSPLKDRTKTT
jgi:hypothetical protein